MQININYCAKFSFLCDLNPFLNYESTGTVVSRQKVPLPKLENCYFDVLHLNIGKEINVFGKVYLVGVQ